MYRPLLSLAFLFALQCFVSAQEVGSAAAYNAMRNIQLNASANQTDWHNAKKITYLKNIPKEAPEQSADFTKVAEGWEGEMSYWEFKVMNIKGDKDMLLVNGNRDVIWLVGYPTKDFTTDQVVRIVGPVKAGQTRSYETVAGSNRTVRTFSLLQGEAVSNFEKELDRKRVERERNATQDEIKKVVKSIIWGKQDAVHPRSMEKLVLKKYKEELEQVGRYIKASKITAGLSSPMTYDPKKKRIEFDSEESRTIATDHLKSLSADIPK
jgi:hypothetical protein